jgi:hypothetical protein
MLAGEPKGKRSAETPRRICNDNIKTDLKDMGASDCIFVGYGAAAVSSERH